MARTRCHNLSALGGAISLALLIAAVPGHRAAAQLLNPSSDNQPLQVQADSGIEWQQNEKLYIARGNAVATRGPASVRADTLIAHYREVKGGGPNTNTTTNTDINTGGNTEIYRVEAEGNVTMTREGQTILGDRAVYDLDQALMVVTGKALKLTTATDTVTARDSLEWYDQKQVAVARGNAVAVRNGKTIKADILTAYMVKTKPADAKSAARPVKAPAAQGAKPSATPVAAAGAPAASESKISRVDAQGHVVVTNAVDTGRGDYGVYNADTGICTLVDNVVIARGKDVIKGQYGVMDLNKNVSRMLPAASGAPAGPPQRVQGLFVRDDQARGTGGAEGGAPGHKTVPPTEKKKP
ncbi:MAG TPA: LptA/OstA family protein [Stellaceae bacterium]